MSSGLSGEKEIQDIVFKCILNVLIPRAVADTDRYRIVPKVYFMSDISYFQIHCCISR